MKIADLMSRGVEFIEPSATVQAAAELMGELDVGALPVGDANFLDGIITDRDILYRLVAGGLDPTATQIRAIASRPVIMCHEDDPLHVAMDLMAANHVRRLPVMNQALKITGWVTLADVARKILVESAPVQSALQDLTGHN